MQFVEPIKDKKRIEQIKNNLRWSGKIRDLLLFHLGIASALRISDLLSLKVSDVLNDKGNIKEYFEVTESKTNKKHRVTINPKLVETIELYKTTYPNIVNKSDNYLFFAQKTFPLGSKGIDRKMWRLLIDQRCSDIGLVWNYWGHTLRKTRWFQARVGGVSLELIQHKLNHASLTVTKRYLGITNDELAEVCNKLDL
jgi:integrase